MSEQELRDEIAFLRSENRRLRQRLSDYAPPLRTQLRKRGFRIYKKDPSEDLFLPEAVFLDDFYRNLLKYSFRIFLRDVIKHQFFFTPGDVTRYATAEVTGDYVDFLLSSSLIARSGSGYCLKKQPVKSFGSTLEWLLAEILRREFAAEAEWGVKFRRPSVGGDYDVIAKIDSSLLYAEVKSSPPKQIFQNEIAAFLDRVFDLVPDIALFFMDTELRMKDKIVPMFEAELPGRSSVETSLLFRSEGKSGGVPAVERMERELFHIANRIFIINAKESIVNNVEKVLNWSFRNSR